MAVKLTEKAEKVLQSANAEALRLGHGYVGTEHILWALLVQPDSVAVQALVRCDVEIAELDQTLCDSLEKIPTRESSGSLPFTPHSKRCLELAGDQAVRMAQFYIGTEHLLFGLLREEEGEASRILAEHDVEKDRLQKVIQQMLGGGSDTERRTSAPKVKQQNSTTPTLDSNGIDLTDMAVNSHLPKQCLHTEGARLVWDNRHQQRANLLVAE